MKNPDDRIEIIQGNITKLDVDAIVNAANSHFLAAEESMARFIAPLGLSYLRNAGVSAAVDPVKRKLLADIICPLAL
jgi:light-regulated signal transduction histidine kinase (bacteriophytochrome)